MNIYNVRKSNRNLAHYLSCQAVTLHILISALAVCT